MSLPHRVQTVIQLVAAEHGVEPAVLIEPTRGGRQPDTIAAARRHAMIAVRQLTLPNGRPPSFPQIGRWFNRDHTTVMHACRDMATEEQGALAL